MLIVMVCVRGGGGHAYCQISRCVGEGGHKQMCVGVTQCTLPPTASLPSGIRQRKLVRTGSSRVNTHSSVEEVGGQEVTDFPGDEVDEETKEMAFQQA